MYDVFLWLTALLLGVVLTILATDPIYLLLARVLGTWMRRPPRGVKGIWDTTFSYRSKGQIIVERQIVELKQFGSVVIGRTLAPETHAHTFQGRMRYEIYFTGTWQSNVAGEIYHGAFQFALDVRGKKMEGKWIGHNSRHEVGSGNWKWSLITDKIDRSTKQQVVTDFKKQLATASSHASGP